MSKRKAQNSFLFITTLGVYLGLVLVGATPVLGHVATTRNFEISEEIEYRDDLDKKPKDCDAAPSRDDILGLHTTYLWFNAKSIDEYASLLEEVLDAFPESVPDVDITWNSLGELKPSRRIGLRQSVPIDIGPAKELEDDVVLVGNGLPGKEFSFSLFRNSLEDQFRFESRSFPYDPQLLDRLYGTALDYHKCHNLNRPSLILKHTEISVESNNLVIATRLPRGSLGELLADSAMQR